MNAPRRRRPDWPELPSSGALSSILCGVPMQPYQRPQDDLAWAEIAEDVYHRDKGACRVCGQRWALQRAHLVSVYELHQLGCVQHWLDTDNIVLLCQECHRTFDVLVAVKPLRDAREDHRAYLADFWPQFKRLVQQRIGQLAIVSKRWCWHMIVSAYMAGDHEEADALYRCAQGMWEKLRA